MPPVPDGVGSKDPAGDDREGGISPALDGVLDLLGEPKTTASHGCNASVVTTPGPTWPLIDFVVIFPAHT